MQLIKDIKALNKAIRSVHNMGARYHEQLHVVAVSAIYHAAEFGQCAPLNDFLEGLTRNYQTALKLWADKHAGPTTNGIHDEKAKKAKVERAWLNMEKGKFIIINGKNDARKAFNAEINKLADGKKFFERDVQNAPRPFTEEDIVKNLENLLKRIEKAQADDPNAKINPALVGLVREATAKAEAIRPVVH